MPTQAFAGPYFNLRSKPGFAAAATLSMQQQAANSGKLNMCLFIYTLSTTTQTRCPHLLYIKKKYNVQHVSKCFCLLLVKQIV